MKSFYKYLSAAAVSGLLIAAGAVTASADETTETPSAPLQTEAVTTAVETTAVTLLSQTVADTEVSEVTEVSQTEVSSSETASTDISVSETTLSDVTTVSTTVTTTSTTEISFEFPEIDENVVIGWNKIEGSWYFYDGRKFMTGKHRLDHEYYVFGKNGKLKTGWQTINGIRRFYDEETHLPVYGWVDFNGNRYYTDKKAGKLTGVQEIDGKNYFFSDEGILKTGFVLHGNYMYYCGDDGAVVYGDGKRTPVLIDGNYYLIASNGYVLRGWQTVNGIRCFYDYETGQPVWGWVQFKDNVYFVDSSSGKYTGKQYIEGHPYLFDDNGILQTGSVYFEKENVTSYFYNDGTRAVNQIVQLDDGSYYFDENGYMSTGWIDFANNTYYFDETGKMLFGANKIDGNTYYFGSDGKMRIGLTQADGTRYLLDQNGVMQFGFQTVNGKTYYFDLSTGKAKKGWQKINGNTYYFDKNNEMVTGFLEDKDNTYYFDSNGIICTGWQTIENEKYYFSTDAKNLGAMYTYRHNIDGVDYLFYSTGVLETEGNQKIVTTALSQLGQEGGRPYWTWWGFNFRIEWCACFVSWCATQCGYTQDQQTPSFISCKIGIDWFKAHNQWKGRDYIPKPGDYIFFDWEPDTIADHIGIVDYYEDGYVYTVEGNSSDEVRKRVYDIKSEEIYGFASPDFTPSKGFE